VSLNGGSWPKADIRRDANVASRDLGGCIPSIIASPSTQKERVTSEIPIYFQLIIQRGGAVVG
jgi:hypothetical protein